MAPGNGIHPVPFPDPSIPLQPRPMAPKEDIAVYGRGSVAWKVRMEDWKKRQNDKLWVVKHQGDGDGGNFGGNELDDDPDLPMIVLFVDYLGCLLLILTLWFSVFHGFWTGPQEDMRVQTDYSPISSSSSSSLWKINMPCRSLSCCRNWSLIMGSVCCCFRIKDPDPGENLDTSSHGNCICPKCFISNLFNKAMLGGRPTGVGYFYNLRGSLLLVIFRIVLEDSMTRIRKSRNSRG